MLINPTDLSLFLYTLPQKPTEGSEIIRLYEQYVARKAIRDFIHTTLSLSSNRSINQYIHDRTEFVDTYIPRLSLGRCQGHTQAIVEYVTSENKVTDITVVVYDESNKDTLVRRIKELGKKVTCNIITKQELARKTDYRLYPHIIIDGKYSLDNFPQDQLIYLLTHSRVVMVGS